MLYTKIHFFFYYLFIRKDHGAASQDWIIKQIYSSISMMAWFEGEYELKDYFCK